MSDWLWQVLTKEFYAALVLQQRERLEKTELERRYQAALSGARAATSSGRGCLFVEGKPVL